MTFRELHGMGFVEENQKKIELEIVENRSLETFKNVFEKNVLNKTTVITDGHRSYPGPVAIFKVSILL